MSRHKLKISTHIILTQDNKILLSLRPATKGSKEEWGLIGGHLEQGESITDATIRETFEEIGITLSRDNIKLALVMQGRDPEYIGFFFVCKDT